MEKNPEVIILMATYNGGQYIARQLDSLLEQTYTNWKLIIRDDGSVDNTVAILQDYLVKYPKLSLVVNNTNVKGACANFSALFNSVSKNDSARYIMFCDQDDIWKPEKIEITVKAALDMESKYPDHPVLIYGNFELMNSEEEYMPGVFKLKHNLQLNSLLSFNYVYGCTTLLNRPLIDAIGAIPDTAINHDYWVALVASIYQSKYLPDRLLRYRQHQSNASGNVAGNNSATARFKRNLLSPDKEIKDLQVRLEMFENFYDKHKQQLEEHHKNMLVQYLHAFKTNRINVIYIMLKYKMFRNGFFQTLSAFFQVAFFFSKITRSLKSNYANNL